VSSEDIPRTIQMEGDVSISDTEDTHLKELLNVLKSNRTFGPPLARLDVSAPVFFTITPRWIRFGDYASGEHGSSNVLHEIIPNRS